MPTNGKRKNPSCTSRLVQIDAAAVELGVREALTESLDEYLL